MKEITTEEYTKIQNASLRNILSKVASGKVPTRQEWEFLNEARSSGEDVPDLEIDHLPKTTTNNIKMQEFIISHYDIGERKAQLWLKKLESMKKGGKWPVRDVLSVIQERKDASNGSGGVNNDLKRELLQEQVDMLRVKRKVAEGGLVDVGEVAATLTGISAAYGAGMEQFISYVSAEFSDHNAVRIAQRIANDIVRVIRSAVKDFDDEK